MTTAHVVFEESGELKAGTVRAATDSSLQVDTTTGKRVKVKANAVLLRFDRPAADELLRSARAEAEGIDVDFLWECAPQEEFGFERLARDYYGHDPAAVEAAAVLMRLHAAPMYFYRKGRGVFRPAPPETLRAALAAVERRRQQELRREQMVDQLRRGELPEEIAASAMNLLCRPDRNGIEYKALEEAAHVLQMSPLRLLLARGAIASPYEWHVQSFLARTFPGGAGFSADLPAPSMRFEDLPQSPVPAFSIDDSSTTEIDDAFSVQRIEAGWRIGIHIAAPALEIARDHPLDVVARARMSTVYAPGMKITMLPEAWVDAYSLAEGRTVPALSLYLDVDPETYAIVAANTVVDRVTVAANLRHDHPELAWDEAQVAAGDVPGPFGGDLAMLWQFASRLKAGREAVRGRPEPKGREEVSIQLEGEGEAARVRLQTRRRDAPLDRIVAELMIAANSQWGAWLEQLRWVGVYRSQSLGRVRMSTSPAPHEGLGVARYAWCTSPLRRYVDMLNQRQLVAAALGRTPPYARGDSDLFSAVSAFDAAYGAYADFQERMERYWSLRWLQQENVHRIEARVAREEVLRVQGLPLTLKLAAAAQYGRGQRLALEVGAIDFVELVPELRVAQVLAEEPAQAVAEEEEVIEGGAVEAQGVPPAADAAS